MVRNRVVHITLFTLLVGVLWWTVPAMAMLGQTTDDIHVLEDALQTKIDNDPEFKATVSPMLVAQPRHLWEESRTDFAPAIWTILKRLWPTAGDLIQCPDCNMQRLHAGRNQTITLGSGELSMADLLALTNDPRYKGVKSVVFTTVTASGVEIKMIRIQDGAIIYQFLADGRMTLDDAKPRLGLVKEYERRARGESLAYVFIDLGVYPTGLFHISFLEQWGSRNQHITGLTISLVNPIAALGVNYRYLLPFYRKASVSGQIFVPLESALNNKTSNLSDRYAANIAVHCAFSSTFGMFVGAGSSGGFTIGLSMYNPLWFPFML